MMILMRNHRMNSQMCTLIKSTHCRQQHGIVKKISNVEDALCQRWKEYVNFGMWVTFDESRVAGWYNSAMTIGPEPKPIRMGATIHSLCVSKGDLAGYKLHARTYGGVSDESLCVKRNDTVTTQKFVTLLETFLYAFKRKRHCHCVTMDSAYMGDTMGQIGREEWKINMVGMAQTNRTGAPAACSGGRTKVESGDVRKHFLAASDAKPLLRCMVGQ